MDLGRPGPFAIAEGDIDRRQISWSEGTEDGLAQKKFLRLEIPYPLSGECRYLFDILMEDLCSLVHSRSRSIVEAKR